MPRKKLTPPPKEIKHAPMPLTWRERKMFAVLKDIMSGDLIITRSEDAAQIRAVIAEIEEA